MQWTQFTCYLYVNNEISIPVLKRVYYSDKCCVRTYNGYFILHKRAYTGGFKSYIHDKIYAISKLKLVAKLQKIFISL